MGNACRKIEAVDPIEVEAATKDINNIEHHPNHDELRKMLKRVVVDPEEDAKLQIEATWDRDSKTLTFNMLDAQLSFPEKNHVCTLYQF